MTTTMKPSEIGKTTPVHEREHIDFMVLSPFVTPLPQLQRDCRMISYDGMEELSSKLSAMYAGDFYNGNRYSLSSSSESRDEQDVEVRGSASAQLDSMATSVWMKNDDRRVVRWGDETKSGHVAFNTNSENVNNGSHEVGGSPRARGKGAPKRSSLVSRVRTILRPHHHPHPHAVHDSSKMGKPPRPCLKPQRSGRKIL